MVRVRVRVQVMVRVRVALAISSFFLASSLARAASSFSEALIAAWGGRLRVGAGGRVACAGYWGGALP
jgi:hypothetical protein